MPSFIVILNARLSCDLRAIDSLNISLCPARLTQKSRDYENNTYLKDCYNFIVFRRLQIAVNF